MQIKCLNSGKTFKVFEKDLDFYKKFEVPVPKLSPVERSRRRMALANLRHLYKRKCAGTGKEIISNYSSDKEYRVFDLKHYYSDNWNMFEVGSDYNFEQEFFPQFSTLMQVAPRPALQRAPEFDENSDYTNHAGKNKNCYLIFDSDYNWDCYYSYSINSSKNCLDSYRLDRSELCYECVDCINCYCCKYTQNSENCSNSWFLKNCIGCAECFACVNLRNKKHCFFNEQLSKVEYEHRLSKILNENKNLEKFRTAFSDYSSQFVQKNLQGSNNENSLGNYLYRCKNAFYCFDSRELWDCRYIQQSFDDAKNSMDCTEVGDGVEYCYESAYVGYGSYYLRFCSHALGKSSNLTYCYSCPNCSDCFGCVGLRNAQYCIFNKRYSKEDYNKIIIKIIKQMNETGEWGEYFPMTLSPFAYNESHAYDFYPISEEQAVKEGLKWKNFKYEKVNDANARICSCGKEFRIIKQELEYYNLYQIPLPDYCFNCRHVRRMNLRGERDLRKAKCFKCAKDIITSLSSANKACCEYCYLNEVE